MPCGRDGVKNRVSYTERTEIAKRIMLTPSFASTQLPSSWDPLTYPEDVAGLSDEAKGDLVTAQTKPLVSFLREVFMHLCDHCTCQIKTGSTTRYYCAQVIREAWEATLATLQPCHCNRVPLDERMQAAAEACYKLATVAKHFYTSHLEAIKAAGCVAPLNTFTKHLYAFTIPLGLLSQSDPCLHEVTELGGRLMDTAPPACDDSIVLCTCFNPFA